MSFKNSSEWLGEIPKNWTITKFGRITDIISGNSIKDNDKDNYTDPENAIPYIATKDVEVGTDVINYDNGMYIKENDLTFKRAYKDDILMCIEGGSAGRKISYLNQEVCYINKLARFNVFNCNSKFFYYYLKSPSFKEEFKLNLSGLIGGVSIGKLKGFSIALPDTSTQQKIVDLLDEKCNEIDLIITNTKYTIDEYKKIKQSLIKESVTIGLNKNIKMKESNVEWIGKTPEHWKMCNPYRYSRIIRGNSAFTKDDLKAEGDFVGLQYGKTYKTNEIDNDFNFYVESKFYKEDQVIIKGSTIFITTSETMEDLGHSTFYNRDDIGLLGGEQISILPNSETFDNKYFYYASTCFKYEMNKFATGLKVFRTKANDLKKINMMIPPLVEQKEIVSYLDEKCNEIDNLIDKKHEILKELETYKQSLIFEYVTGKKDV